MPQVTPRLALVALMLGIVPARAQDRRPLRLTGITQEGPGIYRVSYRFATRGGAVCDGDALVCARRAPDGGFLVAGIRALSGC
jgi:hypothetical protein